MIPYDSIRLTYFDNLMRSLLTSSKSILKGLSVSLCDSILVLLKDAPNLNGLRIKHLETKHFMRMAHGLCLGPSSLCFSVLQTKNHSLKCFQYFFDSREFRRITLPWTPAHEDPSVRSCRHLRQALRCKTAERRSAATSAANTAQKQKTLRPRRQIFRPPWARSVCQILPTLGFPCTS